MSRGFEVRVDLAIAGNAGESVSTSPASEGSRPPWKPERLLELLAMALLFCVWSAPRGTASQFIRDDSDGNGSLDIWDAVRIFDQAFPGTGSPGCADAADADAADADDSGTIGITDGIRVPLFLFLGGDAPPGPRSGCGADDTKDDLDCETCSPFQTG